MLDESDVRVRALTWSRPLTSPWAAPPALTRIVTGASLKYLGLATVLSWHYCLWFVPGAFPGRTAPDDLVTVGWLTTLTSTVATVTVLARILGRARHLPHTPALIWAVAGTGAAATLVVTCSDGPFAPVAIGAGSAVLGASAGCLWLMWGERYAAQRARFTVGRIAPIYGATLLTSLGLTVVLPGLAAPAFIAALPLLTGGLLHASWRLAPRHAFPPVLPRKTARHGRAGILTVCTISFVAAFIGYFTVAIIPRGDLVPGTAACFTLGIAIGGALLLGIGALQALMPSRSTVFRLFPWLVFGLVIACLLAAIGPSTDSPGFLLALAVSSVLEVLLIIYMARLTLSGYTPPTAAFALGQAAIRLGLAGGNGLALTYGRSPAFAGFWTTPTLLVFAAILAGLLIPLVRQEYAIQDLVRDPAGSEWNQTIDQIATEFKLSSREKQIAGLLGRGYTASAIAEKLVISTHTVNSHTQHIYEKLGIHRRSELLDYLNRR